MTTNATRTPITGDFEPVMNFWLAPELGGHEVYYPNTASYHRRKFDEKAAKVTDCRGYEDTFKLGTNGFQYAKHTSVEKEFVDLNEIETTVYRETEELVRNITGAPHTKVLSHLTRRGVTREKAKASVNPDASDAQVFENMTPALNVHIDFSRDGAVMALKDNFPDLYEQHAHKHWSIIGCWRPIKPVHRDPMCFGDSLTTREEDLKSVRGSLPPKGIGHYADVSNGKAVESFYVKFNPDQKFYWISEQQPDEVALFVLYDSRFEDGKSVRCPHSAFALPGTDDEPTRESIEIRTLVFWD